MQRKVLYRNVGGGKFADISTEAGPGIAEPAAARGLAVGDFDNDGDLDIVVNCVNSPPQLLRCDNATGNRWLKIKLKGTKSNRSGIGARIVCQVASGSQSDEVRSGGSYLSQSDFRVHFGLGAAEKATLEIRWPSGVVQRLEDVDTNQVLTVVEPRS